MFELGVLALSRAVENGAFGAGWELNGIGTVEASAAHRARRRRRARTCCRGASRAPTRDVLRDHDVGLALMYTPHPSLVPIEMASAGMVDRHQQLREQDAGGDGGDLVEPDHRRAEPRRARRTGSPSAVRRAGGLRGAGAGQPRALEPDWDQTFDDDADDQGRSSLTSELLGDPRRLAVEDPDGEDADAEVDRDRREQARTAARRVGRPGRARDRSPRAARARRAASAD